MLISRFARILTSYISPSNTDILRSHHPHVVAKKCVIRHNSYLDQNAQQEIKLNCR